MTTKKTKLTVALAAGGALILPLVFTSPVAAAETSVTQVSLGDSITRGSAIGGGSVGNPIHNELANWSTGTDSRVPSHLQKIKATGKEVIRKNLSVGGTKSDAILGQAQKAPVTTTYATILTGGNDICQSSSVAALPSTATYKSNVAAGVAELKKRAPGVKVFLASVPNVVNLYAIGKTDATASMVHASNRVCPIALGTVSGETKAQADARRAAVDARIKEYNNSLKEIAQATSNVAWDGGAAYNVKFGIADISTADYFHPSYSGQKKLAEDTWKAVVASGLLTNTGGGTPPTNPVATVNFNLLKPTGTVSGSTKLVADISSNETITKVTAKVTGYSSTIELKKAAGDGKYYSPSVNSAGFSNGAHEVNFTVTLASGTSKSFTKTITVSN